VIGVSCLCPDGSIAEYTRFCSLTGTGWNCGTVFSLTAFWTTWGLFSRALCVVVGALATGFGVDAAVFRVVAGLDVPDAFGIKKENGGEKIFCSVSLSFLFFFKNISLI